MSPYKCVGNKLMHKKDGEWSLKQTCESKENCIKAMRLLYGIEGGMVPRSKK